MKKLILSFIFLIAVFQLVNNLNAQWTRKNSGLRTDYPIAYCGDACDTNTAIVSFYVWPTTYIFKTTNAGDNWFELPWQQNESVVDISMVSPTNIELCTANGSIYGSKDGGQNWSLQFQDASKTPFMNYIKMFNLNEGVAMGDAPDNTRPALFLKTTNGGLNWIVLSDTSLIGDFSGSTWRRVDFVNINVGYFRSSFVNPTKLYKTTNGGKSWFATSYIGGIAVYTIKFYNENLGLIDYYNSTAPPALIYRTTDGGVSFESFPAPMNGAVFDFEFLPGDPSKVWMTNSYKLYFSNDTGRT